MNIKQYSAIEQLAVRLSALLFLSGVTLGCASTKTHEDVIFCKDPRPEICTMDYTPVCGLQLVSGTEQWKTYSNACTACSDSTVVGYKKDACDSNEK